MLYLTKICFPFNLDLNYSTVILANQDHELIYLNGGAIIMKALFFKKFLPSCNKSLTVFALAINARKKAHLQIEDI